MPKKPPQLRQNGEYRASTGGGPLTSMKIRKPPPSMLKEAAEAGLCPEGGFDFDQGKISEVSGQLEFSENSVISAKYRKFTPERRKIFLQKLAETGLYKLSAMVAGISLDTISKHRKADEDFDFEVTQAEDNYRQMCVGLITRQALTGMKDIKYDRDGNIISERTTYEQQLRQLILKWADPSYNLVEKSESKVTAGVVAIPLPESTTDSWDDIVRKYVDSGEKSE